MSKTVRTIRGAAAAATFAVVIQGLGTLALGPSADAVDGSVTTTTRVHLRTQPTRSSQSLRVLNAGEVLVSHGTQNGWTKVTYNGRIAYVASAYLRTTAPEPSSSTGNKGAVYTTAFLNLRTGPSTRYTSKVVVARGTNLQLTGVVSGDFSQITYQNQTLWAATRYLSASSPTQTTPSTNAQTPAQSSQQTTAYTNANLNLRTGASLSSSVAVIAPRGSAVQLTGETNGEFSRVTYNGKTLWAATRYLTSAQNSSNAVKASTVFTTANLNLRTGASLTSSVATIASRGTELTLTGKTSGEFSEVTYNGKTLWAATRYLTTTAASPAAPTAAPATSVRYASKEMPVWTSSSGNQQVTVLAAGSTINVTSMTQNGRTQILYQGALRWVTSNLVTTSKPTAFAPQANSVATLNRGYSSGLDKTNNNVQAIVRDIWNRYPQIRTMYGWRPDALPDHPSGRAVDVMLPSYKSNQALGQEIAEYYRAHASEYNINYIIFGQKIWSVARNSEGWRPMADRGGDTANHYDHVHINTYG